MNKILTIGVIALAAILAVAALSNTFNTNRLNGSSDIQKFSSLDDLTQFVLEHQGSSGGIYTARDAATPTAAGEGAPAPSSEVKAESSNYYTNTNIQVQGVDEPDIIKTDGSYIYTTQNGNLSIIKATPSSEAKLTSVIPINGTVNNLFVSDDRLIVFGQENYNYPIPYQDVLEEKSLTRPAFYYRQPKSFIKVFDISDKESPEEIKSVEYEGYYTDARLIDGTAYVITQQPINVQNDRVVLPTIAESGVEKVIAPADISIIGIAPFYQLTTIFSLDIDSGDIKEESFMTDAGQTIYASESSLYLAAQKYVPYEDLTKKRWTDAVMPELSDEVRQKMQDILDSDAQDYEKEVNLERTLADYFNLLSKQEKEDLLNKIAENTQNVEQEWSRTYQKTIIHKFDFNSGDVSYVGNVEVPGYLLNQFSMDEHNGDLRVATTTGESWRDTSENNIYVFDSDLNEKGKLEGLAPKERIYSARFIDDRVYLVTFKNIDPLFVIDLSGDAPQVLGELKIPGYSDYLHPLSDNLLIGIGKDVSESDDRALAQGLKIAIFDVSDVANPIEKDTLVIGDRGSDSDALYDHKAFLLDTEHNLLILPVTVREESKNGDRFSYGDTTFDGAYIIDLSNDELEVKDRVTQLNESEKNDMKKGQYYGYEGHITRTLVIDNSLYTLSSRALEIFSLDSFDKEASVKLPQQVYFYGYAADSRAGVGVAGTASPPTPVTKANA